LVLIAEPEYFYNEDINQEEETMEHFELYGKHVILTPMMEHHIEPLYAASLPSTSLRNIHFHNQSLEIGATWYHPDKWRTAINTECKYLLLQHAFEKWQMKRVEFRTDECNKRSRAAISRLGALEEGILRMEKKLQDGRIRNTVVYSILEHEWPSVKRNLEAFLER
jgi:N-acetyltransferase